MNYKSYWKEKAPTQHCLDLLAQIGDSCGKRTSRGVRLNDKRTLPCLNDATSLLNSNANWSSRSANW